MPIPVEERLRFFVYVIESPSAADLYHGRHEGTMLQQGMQLNRIECVSRLVVTKVAFQAALEVGLPTAMKQFPDLTPVIHISAHGDSDGLLLSDNSRIEWTELKCMLWPINKALNGILFVCMSCCEGYSGIKMAMTVEPEEYPFFALIGNHESPTWAETSIAFSAFYHLLNKGHFVTEAVAAMNVACGLQTFVAERAEDSRRQYIEFCSKPQLEVAQKQLEQVTVSEPKPELSKFAG